MSKLQGLAQLVQDAVDKSATAIEDVHLAVANEPLNILKKIPPLTSPVAGIQKIVNLSITSVYEIIRTVNREIGHMVSGALGKIGWGASSLNNSDGLQNRQEGGKPKSGSLKEKG